MRVVVAEGAEEFARLGAEAVLAAADEAVRERGRFTIALAGGASPRVIYRALAATHGTPEEPAWERWQVFLGDERAVPESDSRNNLRSARENLLAHVPVPAGNVHPMYLRDEDVHEAARRYERTLAEVAGEPPVLDLVMLGVGRDAHTLSLHPDCEALHETTRAVVGLPNPPMDPPLARVTLTPPVVASARRVLVILAGSDKAEAARAVLHAPDDRMKYPAQIARDAHGDVLVLLDRAASA